MTLQCFIPLPSETKNKNYTTIKLNLKYNCITESIYNYVCKYMCIYNILFHFM